MDDNGNWNRFQDLLDYDEQEWSNSSDISICTKLNTDNENICYEQYLIDLSETNNELSTDIVQFLITMYENGEIEELYSDIHNKKYVSKRIKDDERSLQRMMIIKNSKFQYYCDQVIIEILKKFKPIFRKYTGMTYNSIYEMTVVSPDKFSLITNDLVECFSKKLSVDDTINILFGPIDNYYSASASVM